MPLSELYLGDEPDEMGPFLPEVNLGTNRTVKQLAKGYSFLHMCALLENGAIKCWGYSEHGALGGMSGYVGQSPGDMGDALPEINLGTNRTAVQVSIGQHHTCAVLDNGELKCWGLTDEGRIGFTNPSDNQIGDVPEEMGDNLLPVNLGTNRTALQVSCGDKHTCVLLDNRQVKCWGDGFHGNLGYGSKDNVGESPSDMGDNLKPVDLGSNASVIQISCGRSHTCAVLENRQLKCWGHGGGGTLGVYRPGPEINRVGDDPNEMGDNLTVSDLGEGLSVLEVAPAQFHTCVLFTNHKVKCFGLGYNGELGRDSPEIIGNRPNELGDNLTFVEVGSGRSVVAIRTGSRRSCAILDDGTVKCWGDNTSGQLGYGDKLPRGAQPDTMGDDLPRVELAFGVPPPSPSPSVSPSRSPTKFPSASPSLFPTFSPVVAQTIAPSKAPTPTSENTPFNPLSMGIGLGTCLVLVVAFIVARRMRRDSNSSVAQDGSALQQENIRYEGRRAPRFALAVGKEVEENFPVAKVVGPSI